VPEISPSDEVGASSSRAGGAAGWMSRLRPTAPLSVDASALSEDGLAIYEWLGFDGLAWSVEISDEATATIFASMPALAEEAALPSIFTRGMRSATLREMRMANGEDLEPITDESADVARDFARRGLDLSTLLETIRIGSRVTASAYIRGANEFVESPEDRANEITRLSRLFFGSLERFSNQMSEAYWRERERWIASRSAEQLGIVNSILSGGPVDRRLVADVLQYDLDAQHIAVVAWSDEASTDRTRRLLGAVTEELGAHDATSTVVVAVGVGAAWGWGTVPGHVSQEAPVSPPPGIFIATSQRHRGEAGFRRAHREAKDVEQLLRLAVPAVPRVLRHADVELATLLAADLENAQYFVRRQLGRLAIDDDRMENLRTTLWLYLAHERSVATVAGLQYVARNTVTYRVKQAEKLLGRRIEDVRLNLQSALLLTRVLGDRVLEHPRS